MNMLCQFNDDGKLVSTKRQFGYKKNMTTGMRNGRLYFTIFDNAKDPATYMTLQWDELLAMRDHLDELVAVKPAYMVSGFFYVFNVIISIYIFFLNRN